MGGKGPPRPSSSGSDDWGDESWIVACPCGVNYDDGEEMVECDECGVWVHTACCGVPKGLPTYVCDQCKIKQKRKQSEESEVAQLLADLPSKPVSFDERSHEKTDPFVSAMEDRVHVQGAPGGDPSFFEGKPQVFCRQLWKYSGYAPKVLNLEYKELPEARDDVLELLRDLKDFDVVMDHEGELRYAPFGLENGHGIFAPVYISSREVGASKDVEQVNEETSKGEEDKSLEARKGEVKHSNHRIKPKVKEGKPQHQGKRVRDEGRAKEKVSKKKPRINGDVYEPEDWDSRKVDVPQETGLLCKSPSSSPKNPKAMKKMAVQEFMDGDVILCFSCGTMEHLVDFKTGGLSGGGPEPLCQECEKLRRLSLPLSPRRETASVKREPIVLQIPPVINNGSIIEVKSVSKKELDHYEMGSEAVQLRAEGKQASPNGHSQDNLGKNNLGSDSRIDLKKFEGDVNNLNKNTGLHENLEGRDEKRRPSVKVEPNTLAVNHAPADIKNGKIPKALELPAVRIVVAAKVPVESAARGEDLRQDRAQVVASRPSCADDTETRTAGDASNPVCGNNQQAVSMEGLLPVSPPDNSSKPVQLPPESSAVPSSPGPTPTEPADGNGVSGRVLPDRVTPAVVVETPEDRASKLPASALTMETKNQGSARTAGHLPPSVRGKQHGDRGDSYLQRSVSAAAVQQQASSHSGQSLLQLSDCGTPRSAPTVVGTPVSPSMKGNGEDPVSGKQLGQAQQECFSPVQQVSKQGQSSRFHLLPPITSQKSQAGLSDLSSPSQPSSSALRNESDQELPSNAQPGLVKPGRTESSMPAVSPKDPKVATGINSDTQVPKPATSTHVTPTPVFCQQARQLNGIGHVYVSRKSLNNCISKDVSGTLASQALNSSVSNTKLSVSSLKSPSSGTSSSSPTSPLVTTPSSKPQPSFKVPESLPSQKSRSGSSTLNASAPHSSSKLSSTITSTVSSNKQVSTLQSSKSIPSPTSPKSTKVANMSKQTSRCNSLPVTKPVDGNCSVARTSSGGQLSRGLNHSGSSSKENIMKSTSHASGKTVTKANAHPGGMKPPSSGKLSHSPAPAKVSSLSKQNSGPGSGTAAKVPSTPSSTKHTASQHSKAGLSHKDAKLIMPSTPPVPKAISTMPPRPPSTKRPLPTVLPSTVATTLKDEELALLLHQELNSSPRVPRVPRVRQAGASLQLVSPPSLSSARSSFVSAASGGHRHKDHHLGPRKRTREDRHRDTSKASEEVGKSGRKRSEEKKMDDDKHFTEKGVHNGTLDGSTIKEKAAAEGHTRHHGFAKGNLSIIVPNNDEDGDKKSPAHSNILTLPGLIDEVLGSGVDELSYQDVCDAVLPHWPKLRKPNGDRYAYPSHHLAVLDCLRNRPAWAHLVGRGPKTHAGHKRPRIDIKSLSDSDDEEKEHLGCRDSDELETGKSFKRRKKLDRGIRAGDASERQKNSNTATKEDVRKEGRQARRRRRVEIEDGTDGEDEPVHIPKKGTGGKPDVSKSHDGSQEEGEESEEEEEEEEEEEAESSPSSEDDASNYSTDDEEMVVHRGIRNRRRPTDESSSSEDEID